MWRIVAAKATGTSHLATGQPCQDAFVARAAATAEGDYFFAVVADGAGSATFGGKGAELACAVVAEQARACLANSLVLIEAEEVNGWVHAARAAIQARADELGAAPTDFACTLLGAVVGPHRSLFFQVGDGAIVARVTGEWQAVFWPDQGEYANLTYFVTDPDLRLSVKEADEPLREVALFTDGLQNLALTLATAQVHGPFFEPMFQTLRSQDPGPLPELDAALAMFLDSPAVNARTDDDKTLVLASAFTPGMTEERDASPSRSA